jgi:hypothetical protein
VRFGLRITAVGSLALVALAANAPALAAGGTAPVPKSSGTDWNELVAIGTLCLAFATGILALFTWRSVKKAGEQIELARREVTAVERQSQAIDAQAKQAEKANALPGLVGLIQEYRLPRMSAARGQILDFDDPNPPIRLFELPRAKSESEREEQPEIGDVANLLTQFLENFGVLVVNGFVTPELAAGLLGWTPVRIWDKLAPYVYKEREFRSREDPPGDTEYLVHFEILASIIRDLDPNRLRRELKERYGIVPDSTG